MLTNAFIGATNPPSDAQLASALGPAKKLWDKLLSDLAAEYGIDAQEWTSYSKKHGWSLRAKRANRNIIYMAPAQGAFTAALILGDKALAAARQSKLSPHGMKLLDEAKRYPEGTAVRIEVHGNEDIGVIEKLAAVKLKN